MGMFDTFIVPCLFCKEDVVEQTKAGPCNLDTFRWDDYNLPPWVMGYFNGADIECYHCHRVFRVVIDYEIIIKERKLEPVDNLDYLELELEKREKLEEKNNE